MISLQCDEGSEWKDTEHDCRRAHDEQGEHQINIAANGAIDQIPSTINFPVSRPKTPIRAAMIGTAINATNADILLNIMATSNTIMVANPSRASTLYLRDIFNRDVLIPDFQEQVVYFYQHSLPP